MSTDEALYTILQIVREDHVTLEQIKAVVTKKTPPEMYTTSELAQLLGVKEAAVRAHIRELGAVRIGRRWFIPRDKLSLARQLIRARAHIHIHTNGRHEHA